MKKWIIAIIITLCSFFSANMLYAGNAWTQKSDFGGTARSSAVGFAIGSKGYIGTGYGDSSGRTKDFWEYDPTADTWTQKADFGGVVRNDAVGFSIGSKGYIGTGYDGSAGTKDFWEYDPAANTWTRKADFGGTARYGAVGFFIGSKGYIGTGYDKDNSSNKKDFWEYDPTADTWTPKADFGGTARYYAVGFSIGSKGYLGTGYDGSYKKDFWEYDPVANSWTQRADFGGTQRLVATGFSIGSKGYIGTGNDNSDTKDFWEYDPAINTWTRRADFGGAGRSSAVGFAIGSKGYIGTGIIYQNGTRLKDFWEYELPSTTPNPFTFTDQTGVARSTIITSNAIMVAGIDVVTPISITGGAYAINGGPYTSASGTVNNGNTVTVRQTSSASYSTKTDATLTIGGVSDTFSVTTQDNTTGGQFTFVDQTGVARNTLITSNPITITWIGTTAPISITGGTYSINGGSYTSASGTVNNGNTVTVRQTSSASYSTTTDATLTIGGASDTFSVTTLDDTTPDPFTFTDPTGVARSTIITSNTLTVAGISAATPISITGGSYAINGGPYTSAGGTVNNGDTVTVQQTSSASHSKTTDATLTIGGVYDTFSVTTKAANTWTKKADFGGGVRRAAAGFSIGSKGYIGTGFDNFFQNNFWEYDPNANGWTQKAGFPGTPRRYAVGFSIGSKGYMGTGSVYGESRLKDFWEYDPITNAWTQKADFGGRARNGAVGFSIGSKGYIGTGYTDNNSYYKDFWEYDPDLNAWTQRADFGGAGRSGAVGFSIGSKGYIGTGSVSGGSLQKDFWEYDPTLNAWSQKADFGGAARSGAAGFSIGNKGYIGMGNVGGYVKDFWEYDPFANIWIERADFGGTEGTARYERHEAVGFSIGGVGYIGTGLGYIEQGSDYSYYTADFWEYEPADTTPDPFTFTDRTGVARATLITSNAITVAGIDAAAPISIIGGAYSINGGVYTIASGTVNNGDTVTVRQRSSASYATTTEVLLTIGERSVTFSMTTQADTTGNQFTFVDQTGVALSAAITSNSITVAWIATTAPISITGGTYSINGGAYTSASGTVSKGDAVTVKQTSSASYSTTTDATLTIGGASDTFSVTTLHDTTPDPFTFTDQTGVARATFITSNTITVVGIDAATPISITGGTYSIDGGAYTSASGTVNNGNTVTVRQTSSASNFTKTDTTLSIGGTSDTFSVTTKAANTWSQMADLGGSGRYQAVGFSIGSKGYVGTGGDGSTSYTKVFWEYDPAGNTWTQKADFGGTERYDAVGFSIGNKGYIGTGTDGTGYTKDFWEYDPTANTWTRKADFGGTPRFDAVGFSIGGKGYIGSGIDGAWGGPTDFWEYDPALNTWAQRADFGGATRAGAVGFSIGSKGYIGTGYQATDFWEYDPALNTWTRKADFGGIGRRYAVGFSIGSKGYIGTGYAEAGSYHKDFWEYDPALNTWALGTDFGGSARMSAVGFSIGGRGYIGTGFDGSYKKDFWEYDPADTTPDPFTFTDQTGVARGTFITSNAITVAGIDAAAPISIIGGAYSINGGVYASASGTVDHGDTVTVRQTSSDKYSTTTTATLTIGGVEGTFFVTTQADTEKPVVTAFTPHTGISSALSVSVDAFTATDNDRVSGYLVTGTATPPAADDPGWSATRPAAVYLSTAGDNTIRAWAKDPAGNVSEPFPATVLLKPVRREPENDYASLQTAYGEAGGGETIKVLAVTLAENIDLNQPRNISVSGGYGDGFVSQSGYSTIQGTLTVGKGSLTLEQVIVK